MCFRISRSIQSSSASVPEDERSGGLEHAAKRKARILTGDESQQNTEETRHDHTPERGDCPQDRFGWKRKLSHTALQPADSPRTIFISSYKVCSDERKHHADYFFFLRKERPRLSSLRRVCSEGPQITGLPALSYNRGMLYSSTECESFLRRLNPIDPPRFAASGPMRRGASFPPGIARWLQPVREGRSAIALLFIAGVALGSGLAQARTVSFQLKPRLPQTLIVTLEKGQMVLVHLHLQGGIIGVAEKAPDGSSRPLWLIDLGRGAALTYGMGGSNSGNYTLEITSFERERLG